MIDLLLSKENYMLKKHPLLTYCIAIIFSLSLGMLSGLLTQGQFEWYHALQHPSFTPPDWIFQPVWTVLYAVKGFILATLLLSDAPAIIWVLFCTQFVLNLLWTPLFFNFHQIGFALIDISLLTLIIGILMWLNRRKSLLFCLFLPYELWLIFALILNAGFFVLNH